MAWTWIAAFVALLVWRGPAWRPRPLPGVRRDRPWRLGHRGVRGSLPENTMAAFRAALDAGLDGLETDVQRTRDGHLVMLHDDRVDGVRVVDTDLADLRRRLPDVAAFEDVLALIRGRPGTLLNVELKTLGWRDRGLPGAVAARLVGSGLEDRTIISSFNALALARLRLRAPGLRTGYLWLDEPHVPRVLRSGWPAGWLHVDAVHPHHPLVSAAAVADWHRRGLMVHTWTVNADADVKRVRAAGVDGIIADDPPALVRALAAAEVAATVTPTPADAGDREEEA